jgi:hypothetical protein
LFLTGLGVLSYFPLPNILGTRELPLHRPLMRIQPWQKIKNLSRL